MTLVSIPANPVPEDVVSGTIKTPDGAELRFARWAPPAGRKGTVCVFTGRGEQIEKYFETVRDLRDRGFAVAMIDWRGQGHSSRRFARSAQGLCPRFLRLRSRRRDLRAAGGAAGLSAAAFRAGAFDGGCGDAARRLCRQTLVRPHGAVGADDRSSRAPHLVSGARAAAPAAARRPGRPLCSGGGDELVGVSSFINNPVTSDPVRYARNAAILEEDPTLGLASPTVAWADTAFSAMRGFRASDYPSQIRQPILMLAASNDTIVSTPAIEEFAYHLRAGSHLVIAGSKHEILQEQDRYRLQFWAAFDAFVPGTPLFK